MEITSYYFRMIFGELKIKNCMYCTFISYQSQFPPRPFHELQKVALLLFHSHRPTKE